MWSLIPLPYKLIGAGAIIVLLVIGYRWWSNSLIERGRSEGRLEQLKADEKILKENQKKVQDLIDKDKLINDQLVANEAALKTELRKVRVDMTSNLDKTVAEIRAGKEVSDNAIDRIPGDELDAGIRLQLQRLAAPSPATN